MAPMTSRGWTVHRDVALRLKSLGLEKLRESPGDLGREVGAFKIRLAGSPQVRGDTGVLVQHCYAAKGYRTSTALLSANICTFAAYDEACLAGTLSLRLDSTDGLAADEIYPREIAMLRRAGYRICEFTRMAVDASGVSKPVLTGLFHTIYLYAEKLLDFDFVVIEVNPRHVGYYRKSLGFMAIGAERHNPRVSAPAVLMGMSFEEIAARLRRYAGKVRRTHKSCGLYAYGFSPAEETGILSRMRTLHAN